MKSPAYLHVESADVDALAELIVDLDEHAAQLVAVVEAATAAAPAPEAPDAGRPPVLVSPAEALRLAEVLTKGVDQLRSLNERVKLSLADPQRDTHRWSRQPA